MASPPANGRLEGTRLPSPTDLQQQPHPGPQHLQRGPVPLVAPAHQEFLRQWHQPLSYAPQQPPLLPTLCQEPLSTDDEDSGSAFRRYHGYSCGGSSAGGPPLSPVSSASSASGSSSLPPAAVAPPAPRTSPPPTSVSQPGSRGSGRQLSHSISAIINGR